MEQEIVKKRVKKYFLEILNFKWVAFWGFIGFFYYLVFNTLINSQYFLPIQGTDLILSRVIIVVILLHIIVNILIFFAWLLAQLFCFIYKLKWLPGKSVFKTLLFIGSLVAVVHLLVIIGFVPISLVFLAYVSELLILIILCYNYKHV